MDTSKISTVLQMARLDGSALKALTVVDYAFMLLRGMVITGGFFWLILHPYPPTLKFWLVSLFLVFIIYSLIIHGLILTWPDKVENIYLGCLALDLIFTGIFINLSGGFNSIVFLVFYLLVALHSFYYGLFRGIVLSVIVSVVYLLAMYGQWGVLQWTDIFLRISIIFLLAGFLGFIAEKERHDKEELVKTQAMLESVQGDLEKAYRNLQDIKVQVDQSEKLASIGRLSAELAHKINNPLDGIKNCLTVIKNKSEDPALKARYLELIDEAIVDIENAVRNLLDYAKRHEPKLEEVDVVNILQRTIAMADYKLHKMGIKIETHFDPDLPHIVGDPHQLQEVFFNLILNAIDAMPNGGMLTIEVAVIGNYIDIKIIDTGVGIPQEELNNIFQPFFTTKPLGEGTGLGLPISLEIVRKHHGAVTVHSEVGVGTVFSVTLPLAIKIQKGRNIKELNVGGVTYNI